MDDLTPAMCEGVPTGYIRQNRKRTLGAFGGATPIDDPPTPRFPLLDGHAPHSDEESGTPRQPDSRVVVVRVALPLDRAHTTVRGKQFA